MKNIENKPAKEDFRNHRERMRNKFAKDGFKGFHDYEVLEYLLFFLFRQVDTKPIAKALIRKFGSFSAVLDADVEEIAEIDGMGISSALSLKAMRNAISYYFTDKSKNQAVKFNSLEDILLFLKAQIGGLQNESLFCIYLNAQNEIIESLISTEGTINKTPAYPRKISEDALRFKASSVIIAHNHPSGRAVATEADLISTKNIKDALNALEIKLIDHIIIAETGYYSFKERNLL